MGPFFLVVVVADHGQFLLVPAGVLSAPAGIYFRMVDWSSQPRITGGKVLVALTFTTARPCADVGFSNIYCSTTALILTAVGRALTGPHSRPGRDAPRDHSGTGAVSRVAMIGRVMIEAVMIGAVTIGDAIGSRAR